MKSRCFNIIIYIVKHWGTNSLTLSRDFRNLLPEKYEVPSLESITSSLTDCSVIF